MFKGNAYASHHQRVTLPVSVSISVVVSVSLPTPFLVSPAFASPIVAPACADCRVRFCVVEISPLDVMT